MSQSTQIVRLAVADLSHEWRMSWCIMLAVAAIAAPLLLFFGLKSGVMDTLRTRLLNNPATMEVLPVNERNLDNAWFERYRDDPLVSFVVPHTRRLAAQAEFLSAKGVKLMTDLRPSAAGDPLLRHYGITPPGGGECVLTAEAARRLKSAAGEMLTLRVSRDRAREQVSMEMKVTGVLPEAAGTVAAAYVHLEELEDIERFKDGLAVSARGWPGANSLAYAAVPQMLLLLTRELDAVREVMLTQGTGFATIERLENKALDELLPGLAGSQAVYLLKTVGPPANPQALKSLRNRLRDRREAVLIPLNPALDLKLFNRTFKVRPAAAWDMQLAPPHPQASADLLAALPPRDLYLSPKALASAGIGEDAVVTAAVSYNHTDANGSLTSRTMELKLTCHATDGLPDDGAYLPPALLSQLGLLAQRPLRDGTDASGHAALTLERRGYTGFRMYASSLESVAPLRDKLTAEGTQVRTRADRIEEIMSLNRYLGMLFWIIALASLIGGAGCLLANVYASVERRRRELAVLRLLGVHGLRLCVFPLTSALLLTGGGLALSLAVFHALAHTINQVFSSQLSAGEAFCALSIEQQALACLLAMSLALVAGLMAARRVLSIEPSESLRDE